MKTLLSPIVSPLYGAFAAVTTGLHLAAITKREQKAIADASVARLMEI